MAKERIVLSDAASEPVEGVGKHFPNNVPRFHYYRWEHEHDGQSLASVGIHPFSSFLSPLL
jgi:hypothetical protein